jgi:hypothetical protein
MKGTSMKKPTPRKTGLIGLFGHTYVPNPKEPDTKVIQLSAVSAPWTDWVD